MEFFQIRSSVAIAVVMILLLACSEASTASSSPAPQEQQQQSHARKMLNASASSPASGGGGAVGSVQSGRRVGVGGCSDPEELVQVYQNRDSILRTGMPAYTVEISNNCLDCSVCDVHLACGDFANTELVDPATFRRLGFNDCLVKNGGAIGPGEMISFQYANSVLYPMKVVSASCDCDN